MHTTNYVDTFITVAPDCPVSVGTIPPARTNPSVAARTFARILAEPYRRTSDEVIFSVYADREDLPESDRALARTRFFSKGQPCLRASDLAKKYGWGIHHDAAGRVALYGRESAAYAALSRGAGPDGRSVTVVAAMRSTR